MISGLVGTVVNPDTVFRWSLYLLLALWPITVYWSGRLFGLSRWTAASAAAVAPFLASAAGIGYETKAYVWVGYGVWTQLWASWTLPLAWGFTYRALSSLRGAFWAVLFIMLTVALHYETGYLAFVPLVVWPFIVPSDLWRRIGRAVALGAAAAAGVGLGHRPAAPAVPLGGAQPGARGHRARERLRRTADAVVAVHRQPLRQRPLAGLAARHHDPRGRRHRGLPGPLALVPGRPRPRGHLARHARHVVRADDLRVALRHCAGQQRHLHPALRNGRAAVGPPAGRGRPRLPRTARSCGACCGSSPRTAAGGWRSRPGGASSPACASSR